MRQGENGKSGSPALRNLQREVLVEPALAVRSRIPGTGIEYIAKLIGRLWTDTIVAGVHREGNADLNARCDGSLRRITLDACMVDPVLSAYRLNDLGSEALSWGQYRSVSGVSKLNCLAKDGGHSANKDGNNREQLHPEKGLKKRQERREWQRE